MSNYELGPTSPTVDEYIALRQISGLSPKSVDAATRGLPNTLFGVTIRVGGEAVGMGRVIGDGGCFFEIVDIAVAPAHQRRGFGKRIMTALMAWVRANAPSGAHVTLIADGDAHKLYAQFGFVPTAPESIGMSLVIE
jgi:GNAT superfamily N-acetyltransferase